MEQTLIKSRISPRNSKKNCVINNIRIIKYEKRKLGRDPKDICAIA